MELVSQDVFNQHCMGGTDAEAKQLCIIAFLPSILDSKASGRNAYIKTLKAMANKYKERPYSYLWVEGGAQAGLEQNMGVGGFGYPAVVAVSPKRNVYASALSHLSDIASFRHLSDCGGARCLF
jgi:protein disulfide-isomerase A6